MTQEQEFEKLKLAVVDNLIIYATTLRSMSFTNHTDFKKRLNRIVTCSKSVTAQSNFRAFMLKQEEDEKTKKDLHI